MKSGIIVCGLNGSGKSTLGKALADKLRYYFIDNEDLFFPKTDSDYIFSSPRTHEEATGLLQREINEHESFVFAAVKGDYGKETESCYQYAVLVTVPKDIRMCRIKNRSFEKFGNRMLPGGDLYEQEKRFFDKVNSRQEDYAETWVQSLGCPVIRVDGRKPVEENVDFIIKQMSGTRVPEQIFIREYQPSDCREMAELFYNTVHTVNAADYTRKQLDVWATGKVDLEKWNQSFQAHYSIVALDGDVIIGFGDIDKTGYLDRLYVHKDFQKKGVAAAICDKLENTVQKKVITHASITARPFFEKRGYRVIREQQVERQGIMLTNYVMEKELDG